MPKPQLQASLHRTPDQKVSLKHLISSFVRPKEAEHQTAGISSSFRQALCNFSFTSLKHGDAQRPPHLLKVAWGVRLKMLQKAPNPKGSGSRTPRARPCQTVWALLASRLSFLPGHMGSSTNVYSKGSPTHECTKHSRTCIHDSLPGGYPNTQKLSAGAPYMHRDAKPGVLQESHAQFLPPSVLQQVKQITLHKHFAVKRLSKKHSDRNLLSPKL